MNNDVVLSLLVAAAENGVIGKENKLPWHLPSDLRYFKNTTWGMPILMGRKTFESIGKALPGRTTIVITRNPQLKAEGAQVVHSIDAAIEAAKQAGAKEIFVIGGAEIFIAAMPSAQRIYLTRIHASMDGDAFFPAPDPNVWQLRKQHAVAADARNAFDHSFQIWERITS